MFQLKVFPWKSSFRFGNTGRKLYLLKFPLNTQSSILTIPAKNFSLKIQKKIQKVFRSFRSNHSLDLYQENFLKESRMKILISLRETYLAIFVHEGYVSCKSMDNFLQEFCKDLARNICVCKELARNCFCKNLARCVSLII